MFGDMEGMMAKLQEAQLKIEETKARLNTVMVEGESGAGKVKVIATANREIRRIEIDPSLLNDSDELEDYLIIALNNALNNANDINEREMSAAAKDGMPNIPGFDF